MNYYIKYTYLNTNYWNEIKTLKYLRNIPSFSSFFYIFNEYELNDKQLKLVFIKHPSTFQPLLSFIFQQNKYYFYLTYSFLQLLNNIELLNNYHICYMNPYLLSYLIENKTHIYLSDFSYSLFSKKIRKTGEIFLKKLPIFKNMCKDYPLELHFIYYILFHSWETLDTEKIQFVFHTFSILNEELFLFYSSFINQPKMKIIYSLFEYSHTWDLYILSKLFIPILSSCKNHLLNSEFISLLELSSHTIPTHRKSISFVRQYLEYLVLQNKSLLMLSSS